MRKRVFVLIISIIIFIINLNVYAAVGETGAYNGFEYKVITNKSVAITKYTQNETEVTVPERIGAYTVTHIGNAAFQDQKAVQKINLPETITEISDVNVFWYCTSLKSINLPKNLTYLATGAFTMCSSLEEIVIPYGITKLSKTFRGCTSLRKVVIPNSVTSIDRDTFLDKIGGTELLKNVTIYCNEGSYAQQFASENGIDFVAEKQTTPFVIENREVTIKNNKPQIDIRLTNNCYDDVCTAYAAVYEKVYSDDESSRLYDLAIATIDMETGETKDIPTFVLSNDYKENLTYKIIILTDNLTPLLNAAERKLVDKNADIDNYPKMNLFESNSSNSSWDKALTTENFGTTGWTNLAINDEYNYLPYEAYRSFPEIIDRTVTVDFDFSMNKYMDDTRFSVMNKGDIIVGFITKDTHLYFEQSDGNLIQLAEYTPYTVSDEEAKTYVRAELDLASGIVNYIRVDGDIVAEKISLTKKSNRIDGFDVLTGVKATGKIINRQIRINCDYIVNEDFNNQFGKLPNDWTYELNGSKTSAYEINSRVPDRFSVDVDTTDGDFRAAKSFDNVTGNPVFEIMTLQPNKRDGWRVSLKNGSKSVIEILADGEDFVLKSGGYYGKFYKYQDNVWYGLKAELDLINSKVSIFVNNKKVLRDIDLDIKDYIIDNIEIEALENSSHFIYDDVKLYMKRIIPDDYVPAPVKPEKEETDYIMGMQVCNLWTEGQYNKTWDYIKSAPNRLPVFGPYDEGNP
ncbi:MAG: leucine-rich repeat domain-containing protein, partial [Clostridia bacterium]|nr:leucine-rich repeat domain-containing protein [Clostridia bacterium]